MGEPERWRELGARVGVDWNTARAAEVKARIHRVARRRRRLRRASAGVAMAAAAALALWVWRATPDAASRPTAALPKPSSEAPGDVVTALSADTRLRAVGKSHGGYELLEGRAHFAVAPREGGDRFFVRAGAVVVEVVGTRFEVERRAERVRVAVTEGRVRARWPGGSILLGAGDTATLPPPAEPGDADEAGEEPSEPDSERSTARAARAPRPHPPPAARWRSLAERGDFAGAHAAIVAGEPVRDVPEELMAAADAARLSGHPEQALTHLRQVLRRHPDDPRAPLAAFTLGRVLLDELGRPARAADAFARARRSDGPLAEDALAREVEARSRAGEQATARALAQEYLRRFPEGRREPRVRGFGGLPR
ncbi:MAG TPA: FecR domain-containing protein [Sandaracinaceae bacterium LLY-WYZ-13_1]|nr:FecR domain-containing protein [Sandaracinaceae bacterium LLY-WYZ-13_1]